MTAIVAGTTGVKIQYRELHGLIEDYGVVADAVIAQGALLGLSATGMAAPLTGTHVLFGGIATEAATGGANDGDISVKVTTDCYLLSREAAAVALFPGDIVGCTTDNWTDIAIVVTGDPALGRIVNVRNGEAHIRIRATAHGHDVDVGAV